MPAATSPVTGAQAQLVRCFVEASHLEPRSPLAVSAGQRGALLRDVRELLLDATQVLESLVRERLGVGGEEDDPDEGSLSGEHWFSPEPRPSPRRDPVGDVAFVAAIHLRRKLRRLQAFDVSSPPEELADAIASGLRQVMKATSTVEPELAAAYSLVPRLDPQTFVQRSLAVRRIYAAFRVRVEDVEGAAPDMVESGRAALRELSADPAFVHVRETDRSALGRLDERLRTWQERRRAGEAPDEVAEQLVSDLKAAAEMLSAVERRQELLQYDLTTLPRVMDHVQQILASERPLLRGHLERVRGVDTAVDRLLMPGRPLMGAAILEQLKRVLDDRLQAAGLTGSTPPALDDKVGE